MTIWYWVLLVLLILTLLFVLLIWLLARLGFPCLLCDFFKPGQPEFGSIRASPSGATLRLPSDVYKRPDPMLYSQYFLMSKGLAVTWDNPDIWLETIGPDGKPSGNIVSSHALEHDTDYFVRARIWNRSVDCPAVHLPVQFSFLSFGIGSANTPIGVAHVNLPVKGVAGCPALADIKWRTPMTPGHYCLQVQLVWAEDAEPANNLGQENTNVKKLNSPRATFSFPVRNEARNRRVLRLEADFYQIATRPPCLPPGRKAVSPQLTPEEIAAQRRLARAEHNRSDHSVPRDWTITILPERLELGPGEQSDVTVDVTAPDGFDGRQAINVHAFAGDRLAGGVTLYVTGDGH
jgi:hypothetical protein